MESSTGPNRHWQIVESPLFRVSRIDVKGREHLPESREAFRVLFVTDGRVHIEGQDGVETMGAGTSCLLPAAMSECILAPEQDATVIVITQ